MHISYERLHAEFERVLRARHLKPETAAACATMFADTTLAGIYSHGVNRFPRFIYQLDHGHIHPDAEPEKSSPSVRLSSGTPIRPSATSLLCA